MLRRFIQSFRNLGKRHETPHQREKRHIASHLTYCDAGDLRIIRDMLASVLRREGYKQFRSGIQHVHTEMLQGVKKRKKRQTDRYVQDFSNIAIGYATLTGSHNVAIGSRVLSRVLSPPTKSPYQRMKERVDANLLYHAPCSTPTISPITQMIEST